MCVAHVLTEEATEGEDGDDAVGPLVPGLEQLQHEPQVLLEQGQQVGVHDRAPPKGQDEPEREEQVGLPTVRQQAH